MAGRSRHAVPTGVAMLRDVWVDVEVRDAKGGVFGVSRLFDLRARLEREALPVALITEATRITSGALAPARVPFGATCSRPSSCTVVMPR